MIKNEITVRNMVDCEIRTRLWRSFLTEKVTEYRYGTSGGLFSKWESQVGSDALICCIMNWMGS